MRIVCGVEYDGSGYSGWQFQDGATTVQAVVEEALSRVADHPLRVVCAGRTDTGVHATGQVIHFDTHARREMRSWVLGANVNLPADVCIRWAVERDEGFHARFSAVARCYRYVILNRPVRPAIERNHSTWNFRPLDVERMREAAHHLIGEHDFSSYRAVACQAKSPVRNLYRLALNRVGDKIVLDLEANGFLHHMVRNIAGVLMAIGSGEREPDWAREVLEQQDRRVGGITAAPDGLYLTEVRYPEQFELQGVRPW
ncbi:MAG: tRNA pseudouridine(38-40) synthase TruA [Chromatiales bacterium]|nr:tRNA pseudouridine(38-40) synthase TruA [Chromatiales bacterium]